MLHHPECIFGGRSHKGGCLTGYDISTETGRLPYRGRLEAVEASMRSCDVCGVVDDLPRHITAVVTGDAPELTRHFACCAGAGCPDGSCDKIMAEAGRGQSGPGDV